MPTSLHDKNKTGLRSEALSLTNIIDQSIIIPSKTRTINVLELFLSDSNLRIIPIVDKMVPVGLVSRHVYDDSCLYQGLIPENVNQQILRNLCLVCSRCIVIYQSPHRYID